jgi:hypothetical protein
VSSVREVKSDIDDTSIVRMMEATIPPRRAIPGGIRAAFQVAPFASAEVNFDLGP